MQFSINDYSKNPQAKGWGPGWPHDNSDKMVNIKANKSGKRVNVHRRIGRLSDILLDEIERRGHQIRMLGGYNNRQIFKNGKPTGRPSNHSWGLAIDLNWDKNPETRDGKVHTDVPEWMQDLFNRFGFAWGGDYRSGGHRDPMHFEFMGSPADADKMTAKAVKEILQHKAAPPAAATYTVKDGDTLSGIAGKFRVAGGWQKLFQLNRKVIGSNPDVIKPGQVLVLR